MAEAPLVEANEGAAGKPAVQEPVELFAGHELSVSETEAVTLRWPAQLVVLAGAEGSGKTTVLTSIYEHLSQGSFAGFDFAGSRSLLGFEKICHANRVASGGARPATERTIPANEAAYYHLALRERSGDRRRRHVLLSALSGELYRWARNSREECEKLTFLRRANAIVVLVDGARLATPEHRANAHADAAGILDSLLDARMVAPGCQVEFVFSKLDRIRAAGVPALTFLRQAKERFETKFRSRVPQLAFREIAARPGATEEIEDLSRGLAEAFSTWTTSRVAESAGDRLPAPPREEREFSKFGWRQSTVGGGERE